MRVLTIHEDGSVEEFEIADELFTPYAPGPVVLPESGGYGHAAALAALESHSA